MEGGLDLERLREYGREIFYLGPEGSFTHEAAVKARESLQKLVGGEFELTACATARQIVDAVEHRRGYGVIAVDNNVEGYVSANVDMLLDSRDVVGVQRISVDIRFDAFVSDGSADVGATAESIQPGTMVFAHSHGLAQCSRFIEEHELQPMPAASNAAACKELNGRGIALAPSMCVNYYDVERIATNVQDCDNAHTDFLTIVPRDIGQHILQYLRSCDCNEDVATHDSAQGCMCNVSRTGESTASEDPQNTEEDLSETRAVEHESNLSNAEMRDRAEKDFGDTSGRAADAARLQICTCHTMPDTGAHESQHDYEMPQNIDAVISHSCSGAEEHKSSGCCCEAGAEQCNAYGAEPAVCTKFESIVAFIPLRTGPGVLADLLDVLRDAGLNMTSLVSRPIKGNDGTYSFIATLDAAPWDERFKHTFGAIAEHGDWVKTLAVYACNDHANPPVEDWMLPTGGVRCEPKTLENNWHESLEVKRQLLW